MRATIKLTDGDIQGGCADLERLLQCAEKYKVRSCFLSETVQQLFSGLAVKMEPELQHTADAVVSCCTFAALCEAVREGIAVLQRKHGAGAQQALRLRRSFVGRKARPVDDVAPVGRQTERIDR